MLFLFKLSPVMLRAIHENIHAQIAQKQLSIMFIMNYGTSSSAYKKILYQSK